MSGRSLEPPRGGRIWDAPENPAEAVLTRNTAEVVNPERQLETMADVDVAEAVTELQLQQTAYETALDALAHSSHHSLADFLR